MIYSGPLQEQADREIERRLHHDDFVRRHPEYLTAKLFNARVGKKTAFATSHEAVQYERGFTDYQEHKTEPPGLTTGPRYQGFLDAREAQERSLSQHRRAMELPA